MIFVTALGGNASAFAGTVANVMELCVYENEYLSTQGTVHARS